jgi:hypothetical protein
MFGLSHVIAMRAVIGSFQEVEAKKLKDIDRAVGAGMQDMSIPKME